MIEAVIAAFIVVCGFVGIVIATILLKAYVLSTLWGWFIVPLFGLSALDFPNSIGICIIFSLLTHQHVPYKEKDNGSFIFVIVNPLAALLIGWIVKAYFI